jgi:hypothetical protein
MKHEHEWNLHQSGFHNKEGKRYATFICHCGEMKISRLKE